METDRLIRLKEVGEIVGRMCEKTVRRKIATGEFPRPVYVGRTPMLLLSEVVAVIQKLKRERDEKYGVRNSG